MFLNLTISLYSNKCSEPCYRLLVINHDHLSYSKVRHHRNLSWVVLHSCRHPHYTSRHCTGHLPRSNLAENPRSCHQNTDHLSYSKVRHHRNLSWVVLHSCRHPHYTEYYENQKTGYCYKV